MIDYSLGSVHSCFLMVFLYKEIKEAADIANYPCVSCVNSVNIICDYIVSTSPLITSAN